MKLTIIPADDFISVDSDGSRRPLDLSKCNIPAEVHAVQWFDTKGCIEFKDPVDPFAPKPQNEEITSLPAWALACVNVWNEWTPPATPAPVAPQQSTTSTHTA